MCKRGVAEQARAVANAMDWVGVEVNSPAARWGEPHSSQGAIGYPTVRPATKSGLESSWEKYPERTCFWTLLFNIPRHPSLGKLLINQGLFLRCELLCLANLVEDDYNHSGSIERGLGTRGKVLSRSRNVCFHCLFTRFAKCMSSHAFGGKLIHSCTRGGDVD